MKWGKGVLGLRHQPVLMAGRAPERWQEEISQSVARLSELERLGSWMGSWVDEFDIQMPDGPLWGSTLAELVGQGSEQTNDTGTAATRPGGVARAKESPPALSRRQRHSSSWASRLAGPRQERLVGLNAGEREPLPGAEMSGRLKRLRNSIRLTGEHATSSPAAERTGFLHPSERLHLASWRGLKQAESGQRSPARFKREIYPSPDIQLAGRQEMISGAGRLMEPQPKSAAKTLRLEHLPAEGVLSLLRMERRASRRLLTRLVMDASLPGEPSLPQPGWIKEVSRPQNRVPPAPVEVGDAISILLSTLAEQAGHSLRLSIDGAGDGGQAAPQPGLAGQWSLPLNGPRASGQMLAILGGRTGRQGTSSEGVRKAGSGSHANERGWSSAGMPAGESMSPAWSGQPETGWRPTEGGSQFTEHPGEPRPAMRPGEAGPVEHIHPVSQASAEMALPRTSRILSPLLPGQAAEAALRFGFPDAPQGLEARGEDDDLAELAEKIKRILDEEARRHGIDV